LEKSLKQISTALYQSRRRMGCGKRGLFVGDFEGADDEDDCVDVAAAENSVDWLCYNP